MINQLRHEALSGAISDLAHVVSSDMLADCLTKNSAKPDALLRTIESGRILNVDKHPPFRELMKSKHKAYFGLAQWIAANIRHPEEVHSFLGIHVADVMAVFLRNAFLAE